MKEPRQDRIRAAVDGDRAALEAVLEYARHRVFNLAVRFFAEPEAARDATQEVLIKLLTRLDRFDGQSSFSTWLHTVAMRAFLDLSRSRTEELFTDEASFEAWLSTGLAAPSTHPDAALLSREVKLGCSTAMLATLSREQRAAYVLGEILGLPGAEAARVVDVDEATFRKRLSVARQRIQGFVGRVCGLVNPDADCRCSRRVDHGLAVGLLDARRLRFHAVHAVDAVDRYLDAAALYRGHPQHPPPADSLTALLDAIERPPDDGYPQ